MATDEIQKTGEEMIEEALDGVEVDDFLDDLDDPIEDEDEDDPIEDEDEDEDDPIEDEDDVAAVNRARKAGWRPKDEYKGPPGQWKDFDEFNEVGDRIASRMSTQIDSLKSENAKQTELIQKLIKAQGTVTRQAQDHALAELKERRTDAIHAGNEVAVNDIDVEIAGVEGAVAEDETEDETEDEFVPEPETEAWLEQNKSWYDSSNTKNHALMRYAASMEQAEAAADPDASLTEILDRVTDRVKSRFPKRFPDEKPARRRKPAVEGGRRHTHGGGGVSFAEYPQEVRDMADFFERSGHMTKKAYLKLLKAEEAK